MTKRVFAVLSAAALLGAVLTAAPAQGQDSPPPAIPAEPNIVDPAADANGHSAVTGQGGGVFVGAADFLAIWFSNDANNLYVHIHTTSPAFTFGSIWYSIYVDPGVGADCMEFRAFTEHQAVTATGQLRLTGDCGDLIETVEFKTQEGPEIDGAASGLHTITVPRSLSEHLDDGKVLAGPNALDRYYVGTDTTGGIVGVGILDDTEVGTPYTVSAGDAEAEKKAKKKDTKAKKAEKVKAKNKKKKKKPAACEAFAPGEAGAEAETVTVTDEATEEKPVEQELEFGPGIPENPEQEHQYLNVQVDTTAADAGLFVRFEFADYEDMDLLLLHANGEEAASAAGYNPVPAGPFDGTGNGGHSEMGAEQIDGFVTPDCEGYTIDMVTFQNFPGAKGLKLWLGEPPAEEEGVSSSYLMRWFLLGRS